MKQFTVFFNRRKQWFEVYLYDVAPETFERYGGGRWGYFLEKYDNPRRGLFGELHLIDSWKRPLRPDTVVHELFHLLAEWMRAKHVIITKRNEEPLAARLDELTRNFWKEYEKQ